MLTFHAETIKHTHVCSGPKKNKFCKDPTNMFTAWLTWQLLRPLNNLEFPHFGEIKRMCKQCVQGAFRHNECWARIGEAIIFCVFHSDKQKSNRQE